MPLLKNGQPYTLTQADKEKVRSEVGKKFPAVFRMPSEWYVKDTNPKNKGRIIRPPGVQVRTKSVITNGDEPETWEWSRSFVPTENGFRRSDTSISFDFVLKVGENEMDKLFYLLFCCPQRKNVPHSGRFCSYVLENKELEAKAAISEELSKSSAIHYIGREFTVTRVRKISAYFDVPGALDKSVGEAELRANLINFLKIRKDGFADFARVINLDEEIDISAQITWLENNNLLKFIDGSGWYLLRDQEGRMIQNKFLTDIQGTRSPKESLIYFLKKNPQEKDLVFKYTTETWEDATEAPEVKTKQFQKKD